MASLKCGLPSCDARVKIRFIVNSSESEVLQFRFGVEVKQLCGPHYVDQFTRYQGWHSRKCSDPCSNHKRPMKTRLEVISLETARSVQKHTEFRVIPGQSICQKCRQYLTELVRDADSEKQEEEGGCSSGTHLPMEEGSP